MLRRENYGPAIIKIFIKNCMLILFRVLFIHFSMAVFGSISAAGSRLVDFSDFQLNAMVLSLNLQRFK